MTKPDSQAGLAGGAGVAPRRKATKDSHQEGSAAGEPKTTDKPKSLPKAEGWRGPSDTVPGGTVPSDTVPSGAAPTKKGSGEKGSRAAVPVSPANEGAENEAAESEQRDGNRGLRQARRASKGRAYLMRLADGEGEARGEAQAETVPMVSVDGLAVLFDYPQALNELRKDRGRGDAKRQPQTGSDDFYLGSTRGRFDSPLRAFFDAQMRPAAEWQQMRREADKRARVAFEAEQQAELTIGGLRLLRVGPAAADADDEDGAASVAEQAQRQRRAPRSSEGAGQRGRANGAGERSADTPGTEKPAKDAARYAIPGASDAKGGAVEQRDWLVVGSRSEVAKLLLALRSYSDQVETRRFRTGEVRVTEVAAAEDTSVDRRLDTGNKPAPAELEGVQAEAKRKRAAPAVPKPSGGKQPRTESSTEPRQRIVIRFRVRR